MKTSKELLGRAGILPKLRLGTKLAGGGVKSNGQFVVRVLEDKIIRKFDPNTNKELEYVRYVVEHNGEKKVYDTKLKDQAGGLSYLVQKLAEFNEGEEIIMEMKKRGIKNYIDVSRIGETSSVEVEEEEHEDNTEEQSGLKIPGTDENYPMPGDEGVPMDGPTI